MMQWRSAPLDPDFVEDIKKANRCFLTRQNLKRFPVPAFASVIKIKLKIKIGNEIRNKNLLILPQLPENGFFENFLF